MKHVLLGIWVAHLWLGYLDGHIGYKFGELFGSKIGKFEFWAVGEIFGLLRRHRFLAC